jgi:hypothetical protein
MCGCDVKNALFCFPCLLFGGDATWTKTGVTDLGHLPEKTKKHERSVKHTRNVIDLAMLGKEKIATHLSEAYRSCINKRNEEVKRRSHVEDLRHVKEPYEHDRCSSAKFSHVSHPRFTCFAARWRTESGLSRNRRYTA